MSLSEKISEAIKEAMKSRDEVRLRTVRSIRAEILKKEKEGKGIPNDEQVIQLITRLVNQRRESIAMFTAAGRNDLVETESAELAILLEFLPPSLSTGEIEIIIGQVLSEIGPVTPKDMGKVMGKVMFALKQTGKTFDGGEVNQLVKTQLEG